MRRSGLAEEEVAALDGAAAVAGGTDVAEIEMARREARAEARREWEQELEDRIAEERGAVLKDLRRVCAGSARSTLPS